jgi:uncharacterized FlaG/YvyC family protein
MSKKMDVVRTVKPIAVGITENKKPEAMRSSNGQTSPQKMSVKSHQMDFVTVQARISDFAGQIIDSEEVKLEFEIDHVNGKISVKVINKVSDKVILEIPVRYEIMMDMYKGLICQTIA